MTTLLPQPQPSVSSRLDPNIRLRDIIKTLPAEVFVKNPRKAWFKVFLTVSMVALGWAALAVSPWYLLPILWAFTGTAMTGLFVIGHDCGHRSFSNKNWVNDLVGHAVFLPLFYPFYGWQIRHDYHHKHTNKLGVDNAWDPSVADEYETFPFIVKWVYQRLRGHFWWLGSIFHWAKKHFIWINCEGKEREKIRFSALVVIIGAAIAFPIAFATLGPWGVVKFWLLPWLVFHFWMSTFTIVHHTIPSIPFKKEAEWNEAEAQLCGTVHCDYPRWVEILCHDINVHIPHHISTGIPSYNLRMAHQSLKENWGEYLCELSFSWPLMNEIATQCHLYHPETNYQSFQQYYQSKK